MRRILRVGGWTLAIVVVAIAGLAGAEYARWSRNAGRAERQNAGRLEAARPLDLPRVGRLEMTVLVDWETEPGFRGEPGVSYAVRTDRGTTLFDVAFGAESGAMAANAGRLGIKGDAFDAAVVSHLHVDHVGGVDAQRKRQVRLPPELGPAPRLRWFLPDPAQASPGTAEVVQAARVLPAGLATTGPLARSIFAFGWTEEQALVARLEGKGLVVITGCGHPTLETILRMVRRMSPEPVYAIVGGMHFPLTTGRAYRGLAMQRYIGTGHPPWRPLTDEDLSKTIAVLKASGARRLLISAHDSCDHSIDRMRREVGFPVDVLRAGRTYTF